MRRWMRRRRGWGGIWRGWGRGRRAWGGWGGLVRGGGGGGWWGGWRGGGVGVGVRGVLRGGAAYLPVDPGWPAERVGLVLADAGCAVVVGTAGAAEAAPVSRARWVVVDDPVTAAGIAGGAAGRGGGAGGAGAPGGGG